MQSKIIPSPSPLSALPLALEQALYILSFLENTDKFILQDIIKIRRRRFLQSLASNIQHTSTQTDRHEQIIS